jgi:hypothetical protein
MVEAVGGSALGEAVLDTMLRRRLERAGRTVGEEAIAAERELLARALAEDEDEAARLLSALREERGLGEVRFGELLWRNAALRSLVAERVSVPEGAVRREYRLRHGPAARVRLLLSESLAEAQRWRAAAVAGERAFGELAALHSIDGSAAQGGLLSPIRPDDTAYPEALRAAVGELEVGEVSPPIAVDGGFALVYLERRLPADGADYAAVEAGLREAVRRRAQRTLMQQLARQLTREADVVVLDPVLKRRWERQRRALLQSP